jgi:hypothetical protein
MNNAHRTADDPESVREAVSDTSRRLLPWAVSLLMHAGLVILAVFLVWSTLAPPEPVRDAVLTDIRKYPSMPMAPTERTPMDRPSTTTRKLPESERTPESPITCVPTKPVPWAGPNSPTARPASNQFVPSAEGVGSPVFPPDTVKARRVVFVIDASGSLIDTLPFVLRELGQVIRSLDASQRFTVVFFRGAADPRDRVIEAVAPGLKLATPEIKQRVIEWIAPDAHRIVPGGTTNPTEALRVALGYNPGVVYLLSDNITGRGRYELSQAELLADIRRLNNSRATIHTIQFLYPDPLAAVPGMRGTLQLIAEETGGMYRFVDARALLLK